MDANSPARPQQQTVVPFRTAVRAWFLISLQTFGGPAGQIAVMQRTLVDEHRWIGQRRFLHAMNYCMLLPGPEAQQLATYVGWLLHGTRGGLVAGGLFVLPGLVALLVLSAVYVAFGDTTAVLAVFAGLAPAVLAIVAQAVQRVAKRALNSRALVAIAVAAFLALALFGVPFPVVVALAETTPGPLIMVVQFVAFLGAYRDPGALDPWAAAVLASLLVTWVTFVPSFLFVLLGAPYMERLRGNRSLSSALTGITAAVVGVIANLGVYFAVHTLFAETVDVDTGPLSLELPDVTTLRWVPLAIALVAAALLFRL